MVVVLNRHFRFSNEVHEYTPPRRTVSGDDGNRQGRPNRNSRCSRPEGEGDLKGEDPKWVVGYN